MASLFIQTLADSYSVSNVPLNQKVLEMVQVKVTEGILEGEKLQNPYGGEFYSFKGIPYADPPIGDLRFKGPVPKQPWQGVREAKVCGSSSLQIDAMSPSSSKIGSEDCLYLNVYTPFIKVSNPLPVMVWIHGGAFFMGSGDYDLYSPHFLVKEGVILVTINYRLDALGFLSLDTEEIPGNAGMKDQVAALRWVKKNITNFGGDPNNVTIFGESAGSMSVSTLMVSPMIQGLYKKVIAQSGTALTSGICVFRARERALALAKRLGCQSDDDTEIYEFFKTVPAEKLIGCHVPLTFLEANRKVIEIYFGVVKEKQFDNVEPFLCEDVFEAFNKVQEAPEILLGYMEHDGSVMMISDTDFGNIPERFNTFRELFVPRNLLKSTTLEMQFEIAAQVKKFYFKNEPVSEQNLMKLLDFYTFDLFGFPTVEWARLCARKRNSKVYLYKFTCKTERNMTMNFNPAVKEALGNLEMASHGDDILYLFSCEMLFKGCTEIEQNTYKCIDNFVKMWTNFAKYGNPTPDNSLGVEWKPYTPHEKNYLELGNKLTSGANVDEDVVQFWQNLFDKYGEKAERNIDDYAHSERFNI